MGAALIRESIITRRRLGEICEGYFQATDHLGRVARKETIADTDNARPRGVPDHRS
ncbi:hypothetical protein PAXINDRAFT_166619 [Paxillus involutus ATCC 200175]|nr:hypothetical protein PAXINDRAFT_166619 [Paxillus involutus ATCC 200175]